MTSTQPIPRPRRCSRCGDPLGREPHWITSTPDGEHVRCRDYDGRPFPYDALLNKVRARYRSQRRLLRTIEQFGRWLAERRQRWPRDAASTVLEARARVERVREAMKRAGFPVSW